MLDNDIYYDNYKEIDKSVPLELIVEDNPYEEIDEICKKLNRIKYSLMEKSSLAGMGCVVESTEDKPIVGTQALDTCYGILFYDRFAKKGIVGHGSPSGKIGTLYEMIRRINDGNDKVIEYMIVSGFRNVDRGDSRGLEELLAEIRKNSMGNIKFVPLKVEINGIKLHEPTLTYEFAFDTRNGKFVSEELFFDEVEVNPRYISQSRGRYGK